MSLHRTVLSYWMLAALVAAPAAAGEPLVAPSGDVRVEAEAPDDRAGAGTAPDRLRPLGPPAPGPADSIADGAAGGPDARELLRVAGAMAVVLGLIVLLRAGLRRFGGPLAGGGRPSGVLEVLARYPIARAQQLVLLKLGRRVVLVHQSRSGLTTLSEVGDPDEVAALLARVEQGGGDRGAGGFAALLRRQAAGPTFPPEADGAEEKVVVDLTRNGRRRRGVRRRAEA